MNWLFKEKMSYFEFACVVAIGALCQHVSPWFLLLSIPVAILQAVGDNLTKRSRY